jgi:hypothetical protein
MSFFLDNKRQRSVLKTKYCVAISLFLKKKTPNLGDTNLFCKEGVTTFMSTGYSFKISFK